MLNMALSLDSKGSVSFPLANRATGLWLFSWWVCLPLNVPTLTGRTVVTLH